MSDDLGLASLLDSNKTPPTFLATVCALNDDGTVSLNWGLGDSADPIVGVAASKSYVNRRATEYDDAGNITYKGDVVIVQRMNNSLIVTGTTASQQVDFDSMIDDATKPMADDIDKLQAQVLDIYNNTIPNISYQNTVPAGFQKADSIYYRPTGQPGQLDIVLVRTAETSTAGTKPVKTSTGTPKPVTLTAVSKGSWRSGGGTDNLVKGADWYTGHPWQGAWFYNSTISSACSGKSVKSMKFTITRARNAGGVGAGANARLQLITNSSKGNPNFTGAVHTVKLRPGQTVVYTLPSSWVSALASGSAKGLGLGGSGAGNYVTCSSGGKLAITFN